MAENTPDRRLLDAIAEALWSMDQTAPDDPSFHVYMEQVTREATVIASALGGVVVLKTDLKQVGWKHDDGTMVPPGALTVMDMNPKNGVLQVANPAWSPVFVLVEPEVTA